jgi:hypothetical protein
MLSGRRLFAICVIGVVLVVLGIIAIQNQTQPQAMVSATSTQSPTPTLDRTSEVATAFIQLRDATVKAETATQMSAKAKQTEFAKDFHAAQTATATGYTATPELTATPTPTNTLDTDQVVGTRVAQGMEAHKGATRTVEAVVKTAIAAIPTKTATPTPSKTPLPPTKTPLPTSTATQTPGTVKTGVLRVTKDGVSTSYVLQLYSEGTRLLNGTDAQVAMTAVNSKTSNRVEIMLHVDCANHSVFVQWNASDQSSEFFAYTKFCRRTQAVGFYDYDVQFATRGADYNFSWR